MTSVFLGIKRRKSNKKDVHKHTSLLRFRRFNISLASCSAAELVSVSVEHCKNQSFKLYLQTVKKVSHVQKSDTIELNATDLIVYYQSEIMQFYINHFQDEDRLSYKPDLQIEGYVSYNDNELLIISFKEVLKHGSWHYSYSSIAFKKLDSNKLVRILISSLDSVALAQIENELIYPHRINGIPHIVTDINNDGVKDIIFKSSSQVRATEYTAYSIYFSKSDTLKLSHLSFSGETDQCCYGDCGKKQSLSILYLESLPIIEVNTKIIECIEEQVKRVIVREFNELFQWDEKNSDFIGWK